MATVIRNSCWLVLLAGAIAVAGCATVPFTGRHQLLLTSQAEENHLGSSAFRELTFEEPILPDARVNRVLTRVGRRIATAAARPSYSWEFVVFDEPETVNAFALPAGKVGVYSGILPIAHDEAGLAVVIGHEVAHAIARHGAERSLQSQLLQLGGAVLAVGLGASPETNLLLQAYGLGAQLGVLLPFSRGQESEADHIGLILMAKAGYDPGSAIDFWQRMDAHSHRGPPEFLSTHPAYGTRASRIRSWLPEARLQHHGITEGGEPLPALDSVEHGPADERALFSAIARINRLAAQEGEALLRAMVAEFRLGPATIVNLQRELHVSPGGLAVFLVLREAVQLQPQMFTRSLRSAPNWPRVVRDLGAEPGGVSSRIQQLSGMVAS